MTERQKIFQEYLLQQLGFVNDNYLEQYLVFLESNIWIHKPNIIYSHIRETQKDYYTYHETLKTYTPNEINVLSLLTWEHTQKRLKSFKRNSDNSLFKISATDMASFKFCPISFSIKKSFQKLDSILLEKGSFHHDRHLLLQHLKKVYLVRKKKPHTEEQDINMNIRNLVRSFYPNFDFNSSDYHKYAEDIANSELYFYGHDISIERKNYFQNIENNVTMQPDYILKNNKNEFFVIEEKIKFGTKSTDFYANDKVQIASYLTFLKDFNLSYGYLIYWHFENIFSRSPEFCSILRIDKSNELENYVFGLHKYLRDFISKKKLNVENLKYNPKKCAKCSVNLICGHKNRRHNELTIPYDNKFLDLLYVPYPENLK